MAIIHQASLTPNKSEVVATFLDTVDWGGSGALRLIGGYRFDDPEGQVGVEGLIVERGDLILHVPLTYRPTPLEDADAFLITQLEHSALGARWVYNAEGDPVARACFARALSGQQEQAVLEVYDAQEQLVEIRQPAVKISTMSPASTAADSVRIVRLPSRHASSRPALEAVWEGGAAIVVDVI